VIITDATMGAITALVTALVLAGLLRASQRERARVNQSTGEFVVRYSLVARIFAWLMVPGDAAICFVAFKAASSVYVAAAISVVASTAIAGMWLEFMCVSASWSERGIAVRTPWRGPRAIPWLEIVDVSFVPNMSWFVLRGVSGAVIRLPKLLSGLPQLLEELRNRANPAIAPHIDEAVSSYRSLRR